MRKEAARTQGYTASKVATEGFDGWGQAASTRHDCNEVTRGLGERYEIGLNTYKPFACGIVAHPARPRTSCPPRSRAG